MKIKHSRLKELYKEYILDITSESRLECPPPQGLLDCIRSEAEEIDKIALLNHVTQCAFCLQEFDFIVKALRNERKLRLNITRLISNNNKEEKVATRLQKYLFSRLSRRFVTVIASIFLILLSIFIIINIRSVNKGYRTEDFKNIKIIEPKNKTYEPSQLLFKWRYVSKASFYRVEIFDESLFPIWESGNLDNNFLIPTKELMELLSNKRYFWMVTAFTLNGVKFESRLEEFRINK